MKVTLPTGPIDQKLKQLNLPKYLPVSFATVAPDDNLSFCVIIAQKGGGPSLGAKSDRMNLSPQVTVSTGRNKTEDDYH